ANASKDATTGKIGKICVPDQQVNRSNQMEYEHMLFTNFNQLWPLVNRRRAISLAMLMVVLANGNGAGWVEFDSTGSILYFTFLALFWSSCPIGFLLFTSSYTSGVLETGVVYSYTIKI
ncbi:hypothetical protein M8C21_026912, partial [Ambrosia artemisiifolia]